MDGEATPWKPPQACRANASAKPCCSVSRELKDMKWLDNAELIRDMPLMGSPAESIMASLVSVVVTPARVL